MKTYPLLLAVIISIGAYSQTIVPKTSTGHSDKVWSLSFSPDGKTFVSGSYDGLIKLWDVMSGRELKTFSGYTEVRAIEFSPNGQHIASGGKNGGKGLLIVWDVLSGIQIIKKTAYLSVGSISFSPDSKRIIYSDFRGNYVIDALTGKELFSVGYMHDCLQYSPDGKYIATSNSSGLKLFDAITGKQISELDDQPFSGNALCFSNESDKIAVSGKGDILMYGIPDLKKLKTYKGHVSGEPKSIAFSSDGKNLISGGDDRQVIVWDVKSAKILKTMPTTGSLMAVAYSPDGKHILSGGGPFGGSELKLWNAFEGTLVNEFGGKVNTHMVISYHPESKRILCANGNSRLALWDLNQAYDVAPTYGLSSNIARVAISPDGNYFACDAGYSETSKSYPIHVKNIQNGSIIKQLNGNSHIPSHIKFAPDGNVLAVASFDLHLKLWDVKSGKELFTLTKNYNITDMAFSPNGKLLIAGLFNHNAWTTDATIWNATTGQVSFALKGHSDVVEAVAFSNGSNLIATGDRKGTVKIWDANSGICTKTFNVHSGRINAIAFAEVKNQIFSVGDDKTLKCTDLSTGLNVNTIVDENYIYTQLVVDEKSDFIIASSNEGVIKLYRLSTKKDIASLFSTQKEWLAVSPDGYFDCSPNGADMVSMVKDNDAFAIDQFALNKNRPDILLKRLGSTNNQLINHFNHQYKKRIKRAGFTETDLTSETHVPFSAIKSSAIEGNYLNLTLAFNDKKYQIKHYNGLPV